MNLGGNRSTRALLAAAVLAPLLALPWVSSCGSGITDSLSGLVTPPSFFGCRFPPCAAPPFGAGNGTFAAGSQLLTPVFYQDVVVGDLNSDGRLDFILAASGDVSRVCLGDSDSVPTFSCTGTVGDSDDVSAAALGDLDDDGDLDLILANASVVGSKVHLNNGNGTFGSSIVVDAARTNASGVAVGDLDGDGTLDAVFSYQGTDIIAYRGKGDGTFARFEVVDPTALNFSQVALGDLDGDHHLDVVVTAFDAAALNRLYLGRGDGTFGAAREFGEPSDSSRHLALGDMNSDGALDIVVANSTISRVYFGNGDGTVNSPGTAVNVLSRTTNGIAVGDLNGDGHLDIFAANTSGTENWVFINDGTGTDWSNASDADGQTGDYTAVALGKFAGDTKIDAVVSQTTSAESLFYQGQ